MILSTMHQCKYIIPFAFPGKGGRKAGIPIPHQNNWFSTALGSLGELKKTMKHHWTNQPLLLSLVKLIGDALAALFLLPNGTHWSCCYSGHGACLLWMRQKVFVFFLSFFLPLSARWAAVFGLSYKELIFCPLFFEVVCLLHFIFLWRWRTFLNTSS